MSKNIATNVLAVLSNLMHFGAALGFIVYVVLEYRASRTPQLHVLALVAATEFLGVVLDKIRERRDAHESRKLRSELDAVKNKLAIRSLTPEQRDKLKPSLSIYKGQNFQVSSNVDNPEGIAFGRIIRDFLVADCGWIHVQHPWDGDIATQNHWPMGEGITVIASGLDASTNREGGPSTVPICDDVMKMLADVGITTFHIRAMTIGGLAAGVIGIAVGVKPIEST